MWISIISLTKCQKQNESQHIVIHYLLYYLQTCNLSFQNISETLYSHVVNINVIRKEYAHQIEDYTFNRSEIPLTWKSKLWFQLLPGWRYYILSEIFPMLRKFYPTGNNLGVKLWYTANFWAHNPDSQVERNPSRIYRQGLSLRTELETMHEITCSLQ